MGAFFALKGDTSHAHIGAEGLFRVARIDKSAYRDPIARTDSRQFEHQIIGMLHIRQPQQAIGLIEQCRYGLI